MAGQSGVSGDEHVEPERAGQAASVHDSGTGAGAAARRCHPSCGVDPRSPTADAGSFVADEADAAEPRICHTFATIAII